MNACIFIYLRKTCIWKKSNFTEVNRFECTSSKINSMLEIWSCPLFTMLYQYLAVSQFKHGDIGYVESISAVISRADTGIPSKWMCLDHTMP